MLDFIVPHFKGKILFITPFPRHLSKCCDILSHRVLTGPFLSSILDYFQQLGKYLCEHPMLRYPNVEIVHYEQVFGVNEFSNDYTVDGVHLSDFAREIFGHFLSESFLRTFTSAHNFVVQRTYPLFDVWLNTNRPLSSALARCSLRPSPASSSRSPADTALS